MGESRIDSKDYINLEQAGSTPDKTLKGATRAVAY